MPWTRDQMAARAAQELQAGFDVPRTIVGAPYDKRMKFTTRREREAA